MYIKIMAAGDSALVVEFGNKIDEQINAYVHALAEKIEQQHMDGVIEVVPTFRSVLIYYDMYSFSYQEMEKKMIRVAQELQEDGKMVKKIIKIPCCYGARFGQDLADMEKITGLSRDEIIEIHSSVDYKIYMLGFLPGFVYLGGMDKRIEAPRLKEPRVKINKGAIGIGGSQTGIYPMDSPGGWRLIGATPVELYNPDRKEPILLKAGEYIRFVPISLTDYYDIIWKIKRNTFKLDVTEE